MAGRKISSCEAILLPRNDKCTNHDSVSANGTKGDGAGGLKSRSCVISTSITSADQTSESASTSNELISSKTCEISTPSSVRISSSLPMSLKSDIIIKHWLPLSKENYVMDVGKKQVNHLNAIENGFSHVMRDKQYKTESSCSESSSGTLPLNSTPQETMKKAKSFRNNSGSMISSNSAGFHHRVAEPVTPSSESGISAQNDHTVVAERRARNSLKILLMVENLNSYHNVKENILTSGPQNNENGSISMRDEENSHEQGSVLETPTRGAREAEEETDNYRWVSGCTLFNKETCDGSINGSLTCSGFSNAFNCLTYNAENIRSDENGNNVTFYSGEGMLTPNTSGESEDMMSVEGNSGKMDHKVFEKINDGFHWHESSDFLMEKPVKVSGMENDTSLVGFDLNEDINKNKREDHGQSVVKTVSSLNVIHVVPKAGVPRGRPVIPMKFEGSSGWKGSAATSAFHRPLLSKSFSKDPYSSNFRGIDLNIAAPEDTPMIEMPTENLQISSAASSRDACSEVGSRRAERLSIDLNCLSDDVDDSPQSAHLVKSKKSHLVELDLNTNNSTGNKCNNVGWQENGDKASLSVTSRRDDLNVTRFIYLSELSSEHAVNYAHAHSSLVAAPSVLKQVEEMQRVPQLQPNVPYQIHALPPQHYPSNGPFYIGPMKPLMFNTQYPATIPCGREPQNCPIYPQFLNLETVPTSLGSPLPVEVSNGKSFIDATSSRHRIDARSEDRSPRSTSKRDKYEGVM